MLTVTYLSSRDEQHEALRATSLNEAMDEVVDALSIVAAEGRALPQSAKILSDEASDALLAIAELSPRKGCCSGWEIIWQDPSTEAFIGSSTL